MVGQCLYRKSKIKQSLNSKSAYFDPLKTHPFNLSAYVRISFPEILTVTTINPMTVIIGVHRT